MNNKRVSSLTSAAFNGQNNAMTAGATRDKPKLRSASVMVAAYVEAEPVERQESSKPCDSAREFIRLVLWPCSWSWGTVCWTVIMRERIAADMALLVDSADETIEQYQQRGTEPVKRDRHGNKNRIWLHKEDVVAPNKSIEEYTLVKKLQHRRRLFLRTELPTANQESSCHFRYTGTQRKLDTWR